MTERGCDQWTGAHYCDRTASVADEVDEKLYCREHAGPLVWDDITYQAYSLAHGMRSEGWRAA